MVKTEMVQALMNEDILADLQGAQGHFCHSFDKNGPVPPDLEEGVLQAEAKGIDCLMSHWI